MHAWQKKDNAFKMAIFFYLHTPTPPPTPIPKNYRKCDLVRYGLLFGKKL